MSAWSDIVSNGFTKFWNAVIAGGKFGIAIFIGTITWIVSTLVAGVAATVATLFTGLPTLSSLFSGLSIGNAANFGLWVWSFCGWGIAGYWAGVAIRFLIRRIPFVG